MTKKISGEKNRNVVVACICANAFCNGSLYAWSAFSGPMAEEMGWAYSQVTAAYSAMLMIACLLGIIGGVLLQKLGAHKLMMIAGILWGSGWFLTGCAKTLPMLYVSFGFIAACGSAFLYTPGIVTAVSWFPDRKGFASGLVVGVCGLASLVMAPLATALLGMFGVMNAFKMVGALFLLIAICTTWYIDAPKPGWKPEGYVAQAVVSNASTNDKNWKEMIKDKQFYLLWITLLCASVAGLMLIGHAAKIGMEVAGISAAQAAMLVGIMALANFFGRLILGSLSDKIGRHSVVIICMLASAADMVFLANASGFIGFVICIVVAGACFGGVLATYSALCSDTFGIKYNGLNYAILFTGYGIASIVGPNAVTTLHASTGGYSMAFILAAVFSFAAAVFCFMAKKLSSK